MKKLCVLLFLAGCDEPNYGRCLRTVEIEATCSKVKPVYTYKGWTYGVVKEPCKKWICTKREYPNGDGPSND